MTPSDGGTASMVDPLPRDRREDVSAVIELTSMISCGDIKRCDDDLVCLYFCRWLLGERDRKGIGVEDNAFKLGVDNPLPLAVKADERGADVMASISSVQRRPICIIVLLVHRQMMINNNAELRKVYRLSVCVETSCKIIS